MTTALHVYVPGTALPQGSKRLGRAFTNPNTGRTSHSIIDNNPRLASWRMQVTNYTRQAMAEAGLFAFFSEAEPVRVSVTFFLPRPKAHYGSGRNAAVLKPNAPVYVITAPDLDKLLRAILDGCTDARLWGDDSQVAQIIAVKRYADVHFPVGVKFVVDSMR